MVPRVAKRLGMPVAEHPGTNILNERRDVAWFGTIARKLGVGTRTARTTVVVFGAGIGVTAEGNAEIDLVVDATEVTDAPEFDVDSTVMGVKRPAAGL